MKRIIHKRFADNADSQSVATRLRRQRFRLLLDMIEDSADTVSVLDIGGTFEYWQMMVGGGNLFDRLRVTLFNLQPRAVSHPNFESVVGDGCCMPQFCDQQFDIVFSNSTIEHVGDFHQQTKMAREIRRIGRQYYVQTPNRYFPIEPHFIFPFFQFLPLATRAWLVQHYNLGWCPKIRDRQAARREVESIRLLSRSEMRQLFPEATIFDEKFYGFVKSFVAHTRQPRAAINKAPAYAAAR